MILSLLASMSLLRQSINMDSQYITIDVNKVCADIVSIPYKTTSVTDTEYNQWNGCVNYFKQYDVNHK